MTTPFATPTAPAPAASLRWRLWAGRGVAAFVDQLLTSGSNFALSIILARALPAAEYGAYAVAFAIFLLIANLYQGLLLTPSLLLGTTLFADRKGEYAAAMIRLHYWLGAGCLAALGLAALAFAALSDRQDLARCLAAMAVATPAVLLLWLVRSAWYLRLEPGPAAWGAALYAMVLVGGVVALRQLGWLTAVSGILTMGSAGMVAGMWLLFRLKPMWGGRLSVREVWREGWQYGRWEMAIAFAAWLPASLCYPVAATVLGDGQAGALRALQNFSLPVTQAMTSVLRLLQPYVSGKFGRDGESPERTVWLLTGLALAGTAFYMLIVSVLRRPLMGIAYSGKFLEAVDLLPWMILPAVLATGTESLAMGLRAMRGSKRLILAYLAASVVYLATGIPAARTFGLAGVASTLVLANLAGLVTVAVLFRRQTRRANSAMGSAAR